MRKTDFSTPEWQEYFKDKSPEEIEKIKKVLGEKQKTIGEGFGGSLLGINSFETPELVQRKKGAEENKESHRGFSLMGIKKSILIIFTASIVIVSLILWFFAHREKQYKDDKGVDLYISRNLEAINLKGIKLCDMSTKILNTFGQPVVITEDVSGHKVWDYLSKSGILFRLYKEDNGSERVGSIEILWGMRKGIRKSSISYNINENTTARKVIKLFGSAYQLRGFELTYRKPGNNKIPYPYRIRFYFNFDTSKFEGIEIRLESVQTAFERAGFR